jgi:hypothetical protein
MNKSINSFVEVVPEPIVEVVPEPIVEYLKPAELKIYIVQFEAMDNNGNCTIVYKTLDEALKFVHAEFDGDWCDVCGDDNEKDSYCKDCDDIEECVFPNMRKYDRYDKIFMNPSGDTWFITEQTL